MFKINIRTQETSHSDFKRIYHFADNRHCIDSSDTCNQRTVDHYPVISY